MRLVILEIRKRLRNGITSLVVSRKITALTRIPTPLEVTLTLVELQI